jgi:capsular polysaccharide biosynthesis protein
VSDTDQTQTVTWLPRTGDEPPARPPVFEDPSEVDDGTFAGRATGLVSLGFIGAALRRSARLWCVLAIVGLIVGGAFYAARPPAQKATVSLLLVDNPAQNPADEILTDMALASSYPVAAGVISQLGLQETPATFVGTYTVTDTTDQVLTITVSAPTSNEAVQRASAVATQFLKFRAQYAQTQQQETNAQLNQQVVQAQQQLDSINSQISQISAQPGAPGQQAELTKLKAQRTAASNNLSSVQQQVTQTLVSTQMVTQSMVKGSEVLNTAVPVKHSFLKGAVLYAIGGLLGGLVLGMIIVIIGAITSERLRRRDDIAYAFGAPVRLSVGAIGKRRWLPRLPRRAASERRHMERVVEHLRNAVPQSSRGPAGLAVVAVDNAETVARAVVALAVSGSKQRWRVVVADLSAGAHAAHLLGADGPGMSTVSPEGAPIVVMVPAADDVAPTGPLRSHAPGKEHAQADEALAAACARADLVLSLVSLDPSFGGEHLATWATDVVAVVTAGHSTTVRVHAVGEMIRLSGAHLSSVVVVGADESDESLGLTSTAYHPAPL